MTVFDLKEAIIVITLSQLERYNYTRISTLHKDKILNDIGTDLYQMHDAWWSSHFPHFEYALRMRRWAKEPSVVVFWSQNSQHSLRWNRLTFGFYPVRLIDDYNQYASYDRAMAII